MSQPEKEDNPIEDECSTSESDSDSDGETASSFDESDLEVHGDGGVIRGCPFRFIFDEEAKARSLGAIAYGISEDGSYFVIDQDDDTHSGLLVSALIERNIKDGLLTPIEPKKASNSDFNKNGAKDDQ